MACHFFLLLFLSSVKSMAAAQDTAAFIYAGCSQTSYSPGSPYQLNVDSLLSSLTAAATSSFYINLTSSASAAGSLPTFGLFQCRGDLQSRECSACIRSALSKLSSLCPFAAGAAVQLAGCFLRYGNDAFVGKPDATVIYKKCGASSGSGQIGIRDAALSGLTGGGFGGYRAGASGYVQAVAQCVGDQTAKQCDDCVGAAVAQLKAACGYAVSGEAYLGKCFARFWCNGNGGVDIEADNHHHDNDETGRTAAIIIGLIAGVALLILFLSFVRKAGNPDKD
ncbi:plasmodesmata-located protein 7-like [Zingiber officinale]|nr:plasmodesmata-located protein 7-like [Zingiber officinale]